jgi:hypothetical protein
MEKPYRAQSRSLCPFFSACAAVLTLSLDLKLELPSTYTERSRSTKILGNPGVMFPSIRVMKEWAQTRRGLPILVIARSIEMTRTLGLNQSWSIPRPVATPPPLSEFEAEFQPASWTTQSPTHPEWITLSSSPESSATTSPRNVKPGSSLTWSRSSGWKRFHPPFDVLHVAPKRYAKARQIVWVREEPRNQGAFAYVEPGVNNLLTRRLKTKAKIRYRGREEDAVPAPGTWAAQTKIRLRRPRQSRQ